MDYLNKLLEELDVIYDDYKTSHLIPSLPTQDFVTQLDPIIRSVVKMSPKLSKPLSPGDVITEDMPIIHALHKESKGKYCDNCFKQSDQLKRCSKCLQIFYCSKECQKNDWKYHKNECPLYLRDLTSVLSTTNWMRILLRLFLSVQKIPNFATKKYRLFDGSDVSLRDIEVNASEVNDNKKILNFSNICNIFNDIDFDYDRQEVQHWLSFLYTIPLIPIKSSDQDIMETPDTIGTGLYIQHSLLGHSCQPNSALIGKGLSIPLRAMRPIAAGEEITISFVRLDLNRADRQQALKFWSIDCECEKCVYHLDRNIDYTRLQPSNLFPLNVFTFGTQLMDYLRQVLTELDVMFGEYHPQKTNLLMAIVIKLANCPLIPEPVMNEMKAKTMKAIDVTLLSDIPFRNLFIHRCLTVFAIVSGSHTTTGCGVLSAHFRQQPNHLCGKCECHYKRTTGDTPAFPVSTSRKQEVPPIQQSITATNSVIHKKYNTKLKEVWGKSCSAVWGCVVLLHNIGMSLVIVVMLENAFAHRVWNNYTCNTTPFDDKQSITCFDITN
ncbi:unnamed protein product, partial [Medioppia subpectinata]